MGYAVSRRHLLSKLAVRLVEYHGTPCKTHCSLTTKTLLELGSLADFDHFRHPPRGRLHGVQQNDKQIYIAVLEDLAPSNVRWRICDVFSQLARGHFSVDFKHKRDIKRIHIVRRFTPVRTTTATLAVLASCDASRVGDLKRAVCTVMVSMWAVRVRHVRRFHLHEGRLILLPGPPRALLYVTMWALATTLQLDTPCASLRFPRDPTQYLCVILACMVLFALRAARTQGGREGEHARAAVAALAGAHSGTAGLHHRQGKVCVTLAPLSLPSYTVQRGMRCLGFWR